MFNIGEEISSSTEMRMKELIKQLTQVGIQTLPEAATLAARNVIKHKHLNKLEMTGLVL